MGFICGCEVLKEGKMFKPLAKIVIIIGLCATPAAAMPLGPQPDIPDVQNTTVTTVASKSQKAAARRVCRAQYGARLAFVSFSGNRYVCHFRKSTKALTKEAARSCRKTGLKLARVNSIKIKGDRSITRFTCKRR
jgi:hypothetical protein